MSTAITILGNTGRDVELRYTPNGTPVANFSIASNTVRNTPNGSAEKDRLVQCFRLRQTSRNFGEIFEQRLVRFSFAENLLLTRGFPATAKHE